MNPVFLIITILFPVAAGIGIYMSGVKKYSMLWAAAFAVSIITSAMVWLMLIKGVSGQLDVLSFTELLIFSVRLDGPGRYFLGVISVLWPLTVLYARSYMEHENNIPMFYGFFMVSYGVTVGIASAANIFTMYCFYEMLTLATVILVIQPMNHLASRAARSYLIYSFGGAALAFIAMAFIICTDSGGSFTPGGMLSANAVSKPDMARVFYIIGFLGFGVKAAVFPFYGWLPKAAVAPTPVTALLHAVAVVKAGAFAVIRLTYYCFGTELLYGSFAQTAVLCISAFTILFGSSMAVKETDWKRRLAFSTISNLSYILFAVSVMSEAGLTAAFLHISAHACIKILSFFCAGAVLHQTGRRSIYELDGIGHKMPVTFACFTFAAAALTGVPPFCGFISKWHILSAAAASGLPAAYMGAVVILFSAFLTAIYMFTTVRRAWFPDTAADTASLEGIREADAAMLIPLVLLAVSTLATGIGAGGIIAAASAAAAGV